MKIYRESKRGPNKRLATGYDSAQYHRGLNVSRIHAEANAINSDHNMIVEFDEYDVDMLKWVLNRLEQVTDEPLVITYEAS